MERLFTLQRKSEISSQSERDETEMSIDQESVGRKRHRMKAKPPTPVSMGQVSRDSVLIRRDLMECSRIVSIMRDIDGLKVPEVDIGQIRNTAHAVEKFYILCSAIDLGIFDNLQKPKNAEVLANELGLHRGMTQQLCTALVASNFFKDEPRREIRSYRSVWNLLD